MPDKGANREEEMRVLLTNALEVQLAAFKAGISFWEDWVAQASRYARVASDNLYGPSGGEGVTDERLLKVLDAGREAMRAMLDLPRSTASRFVAELDQIAGRHGAPTSSGGRASEPSGTVSTAATGTASRTRAVRAKD